MYIAYSTVYIYYIGSRRFFLLLLLIYFFFFLKNRLWKFAFATRTTGKRASPGTGNEPCNPLNDCRHVQSYVIFIPREKFGGAHITARGLRQYACTSAVVVGEHESSTTAVKISNLMAWNPMKRVPP